MNEELQKELYDGEQILWQGKPEPFELMDAVYKKPLTVTWAASAAVLLIFFAFYIPFYIRTASKPSQLLIALFLVGLVPFALSFQPIATRRSLLKNVTYVFTNQRAICVNHTQINAFEISKETLCRVETLPNGSTVIYMGEDGCKIKPSSSRDAAVRRIKTPDSDKLTGMVFYGVKNGVDICKNYTPFSNISSQ